MANDRLQVFVYGTLKQGASNRARSRGHCLEALPAFVFGTLIQLPAGYPMLRPRVGQILALGSSDPLADREAQIALSEAVARDPFIPGDRLVLGEILRFDDPALILPRLDALEDFRPVRTGERLRVLAPAWRFAGDPRASRFVASACWMYVAPNVAPEEDAASAPPAP